MFEHNNIINFTSSDARLASQVATPVAEDQLIRLTQKIQSRFQIDKDTTYCFLLLKKACDRKMGHTGIHAWLLQRSSLSCTIFTDIVEYLAGKHISLLGGTFLAKNLKAYVAFYRTRQVTSATHVRNCVCPRVELILKIIIILRIIFLGFIKSKPC